MTTIFEAIELNDMQRIVQLLQTGVSVNCRNIHDLSPLDCAIRKQNKNIISLLFEFGADVNYGCIDGPLEIAIERQNLDIIQLLLDKGANVNSTQVYDISSPIQNAISRNSLEIVKLLLKYDADVNWQDLDGETPLHKAVHVRNVEIVSLLLENGADINLQDNVLDATPFKKSVLQQSVSCKQVLLGHTVILKSLNKEIIEQNLECLQTELELLNSNYEMEIKKLKSEIISDGFTLTIYDILTKTANQLAVNMRSETLRINLIKKNYKKNFQIYFNLIANKISKATDKYQIYDKGLKTLQKLMKQIYPLSDDCVKKIFTYFNEEDTQFLIQHHNT